jgi:4-hydroxy-tetrahydrodipicolinate synthase
VLAPRDAAGALDERAFRSAVEFLLARNLNRFVLNGATGEYCLGSPHDLRRMLAICRELAGPQSEFLSGIGSAGLPGTIALADAAQELGAKALLLPMPHFFPYEQEDLIAYCTEVARRVSSPILLYNLPRFTSPLEARTVSALVESVPNIIGIKDSSGSLAILRALPLSACRIVGDDSVLADALRNDVCDGAISGVAGVLPELIHAVWHRLPGVDSALAELCMQLSTLPVPWGLKWIAESRGISRAGFSQPVSVQRQEQARVFVRWFEQWWPTLTLSPGPRQIEE